MGEESHTSVRKRADSFGTDNTKKSSNFTERKLLFSRSNRDQQFNCELQFCIITLATMNANLIKIRMKLSLTVGIRKSTNMREGGKLGYKN